MAETSLADIQAQAQSLALEIESAGVNVAEKKDVAHKAKMLLDLLDQMQPHLNRAQNTFGSFGDSVQKANDLRNMLNKVISNYSS